MKKLFAYGLVTVSYFSPVPKALGQTSEYVPEPLLVRSEALGQLFRSSVFAERSRLGEAGASRVSLSRTYANFWGHDKRYIVDAEIRDDVLRYHYQPTATLELNTSLSERGFTKSGTDGLAISFHRTFGLDQDGRLQAPRHNTRVAVPDFDLNYSNTNAKDILSRQLEFGAVYDLGKEYNLGLNLTVGGFATYEGAKGNPYFTGAIDGGFKVSASTAWDNFSLFGTASFGIFDQKQEIEMSTTENQVGGSFGVGYRFFERHEALTQFIIYQPFFHDMGQLSRASYEIQAAYRYTYQDVSAEVAIIENIFWVYNSPDWGVTAGLTYHFGR